MQTREMDLPLRNGIWNVLFDAFIGATPDNRAVGNGQFFELWVRLWRDLFKKPVDTLPPFMGGARQNLRDWYFKAQWFEVYDFAEFALADPHPLLDRVQLAAQLNEILKRELAGFTIVGGHVSPITNEEELGEITRALAAGPSPVNEHLDTAIELFSDRSSPDYRNSIKESISAVESLARILADDPKAELGKALRALEGKVEIHPALDRAFKSLYGYTSDQGGIRHALLESSSIDAEDARYMLVVCSAFINYLRVKAQKAGLKL